MIDYIKKNGIPEQYPIMMLAGLTKWTVTSILQMAKGHKKKWLWHTWDYWVEFRNHDINIHYKCWRLLGIEKKTIYEIQPASEFPHPYPKFVYDNNGHAFYQNRHGIMKFGYPNGGHYPKGTRVEADLKRGGLSSNGNNPMFFDEASSISDKISSMVSGLGFKKEDESENNNNEGQ